MRLDEVTRSEPFPERASFPQPTRPEIGAPRTPRTCADPSRFDLVGTSGRKALRLQRVVRRLAQHAQHARSDDQCSRARTGER